jgi:hypothetical protein
MKLSKLFFSACAIACTMALVGCPPTSSNDTAAISPKSLPSLPPENKPVFANQLSADTSPAAKRRLLSLDVYQLQLPLGTISRSEEFWKHIDEDRVDVGTYDLLRKNGWRLGIALANEWPYFKDILDAYPALWEKTTLSPGLSGGGTMELAMKHSIAYQNIFYFTDRGRMIGMKFEDCDNLLGIGLQNIPRKPGEARVTVCPTVRGVQKRFEVTKKAEGRPEIRYTHPERLYDLNIQADIPVGHILIIAPSPQVRWKTSLGATFLVQDGAAEQVEQVMLFVPLAADVDEVQAPLVTPAK